MVRLLYLVRDCFFLLRRHRNDANKIFYYRHYEEERRSNLFQFKLVFLFGLLFLCITTFGYSQHRSENQSIKIGFLIRDKNVTAIQQAAELAIKHANAKGGFKGRPFELITKSCDGPWGIGSKQAVDLIHEDQVSLVVTALDGRNAHLAEQVAAKSHVVMLSTQSSDPTLSRAYVPWYFRMVPDDLQQAEVFVEEIYIKQKIKKVALISLDSYDGKKSVEAMVNLANEKKVSEPEIFIGFDKQQFEKIRPQNWEAVVLAGYSKNAPEVIEKIQSANGQIKIYSFLNVFNFMNEFNPQLLEQMGFVMSFNVEDKRWLDFENAFQSKFGISPTPTLAYVYDGILLSIEAIRKFGPDQEDIRIGFKNLDYIGITGKVEFDGLGNRKKEWELTK